MDQTTTGRYLQGSSGWGDAIVMVPWELYRVYGDRDLLAEFWPAMVRWVDYAATRANPSLPRPCGSATGPSAA